jgi:hypothetical protein
MGMCGSVLAVVLCVVHQAVAAGSDNGPFQWVAEWSADGLSRHLRLETTIMDGLVEPVTEGGRETVRSTGMYYYFDVDNAFLSRAGLDTVLEVVYFDGIEGAFFLQYDSLPPLGRQSYRESRHVRTTGSGTWKTAVIEMPDAWLDNGQNHRLADMRLCMPDGMRAVAKVALRVSGLSEVIYDTDEAMQQARRDLRRDHELAALRAAALPGAELAQYMEDLLWDLPEAARPRLEPALLKLQQTQKEIGSVLDAPPSVTDDATLDESVVRWREMAERSERCRAFLDQAAALAQYVARMGAGKHDWLWFARTVSERDNLILPWTVPQPAETGAPLSLRACRGEHAVRALGLLSRVPVGGVTVEMSGLTGPGGAVIPPGAADIRILKRWYQAGRESETLGPRQLVPELLLHDDRLITSDLLSGENRLGFDEYPADAPTLLPFDLPPLHTKALWVTVRVPGETPAGVYRGLVRITGQGMPDLGVPVAVEVLPFDLEPNPLVASMYFSHRHDTWPWPEDYRAVLDDMRVHGLTNPQFALPAAPDGSVDMEAARAELTLRREAGVNQGPLLTVGGYNVASYLGDNAPGEEKRAKLKATIDAANALAEEFGYDGAYIYAIDEAAGETLAAEIPVLRLVTELGGRAYAAVLSDFGDIALGEMHMPIFSGFPPKELVGAVHAADHRILRYGSPQGGAEDPWQWRHAYGLTLWEIGLDGGCTWCYRSAIGSPWDDFDDPAGTYRDFLMTHPSPTGPISTVQWEGYRMGNDDLRYMATLDWHYEQALRAGTHAGVLAEVVMWRAGYADRPVSGENPEAVREHIIGYIMGLGGGE